MKFLIKLHPKSSQDKVIEREGFLEVWIKESPVDGKANKYLEKFLRKHFGKKVKIIFGLNSRKKIIEVLD